MARGKRKAEADKVELRAKPRLRKKQAVTKTNNSATKAQIDKNAATSPLLRLIPELRENILLHLLGSKLIHIKNLGERELYYANKAKKEYLGIDASEDENSEEVSNYITLDSDDDETSPNYITLDSDNDTSSKYITLDTDDDNTSSIAVAVPATLTVKKQSPQTVFRHAICVANQSEKSAYQEAVSGSALIPEGESREFYVASCEKRHAACKMCGNGPMFLCKEDQQTLRMDLNILGVCRQLYEEANYILWAKNTFSFDDPRSFEKFLCSLNSAQKRNLTNIHISAVIGGYGSAMSTTYQRVRWDNNYWGRALKMTNLKMLRVVQTLHLCINQGFECVSAFSNDSAEQQLQKGQQEDMGFLLRLRALSVKHITVIVSDDVEKVEEAGLSAHRWTATKKNEYADNIRLQLVDPSGADSVKAQDEAANLARKIKTRDDAEHRLKMYKRTLKNKRADVVRAAKWASREEAKAVLASQKADRIPRKFSKKAVQLRQRAEMQKGRAAEMREAVNRDANREKFWQEKLAKAREKYHRALARLGATPEDILDMEEVELLMEGQNDSDMDVGEDNVTQSEDNESLVSGPEEFSDEDDEISS